MAKKSSLKVDQQLIREAKTYLDFGILFPQSKIDARAGLTKYQKSKINATLKELKSVAGGENHLKRDFIPVKRTKSRTQINEASSLPAAFRGVMLPGGSKVNKNVRVRKGEIIFDRGEAQNVRFKPLQSKTVKQITKSIKKIWGTVYKTARFISLGTYSGEIKYILDAGITTPAGVQAATDQDDALDVLIKNTEALYNKYASLVGEPRFDAYGKRKGLYAHPSKWGLGLWLHK